MDLPLKEGESVEQRERFTSLLKLAHNQYSDGRPAGVEHDFGPGELVLTNKSLFFVADRSNETIRIGRRAIAGHLDKNGALSIYKHDYHYPYDYKVFGLDNTQWRYLIDRSYSRPKAKEPLKSQSSRPPSLPLASPEPARPHITAYLSPDQAEPAKRPWWRVW